MPAHLNGLIWLVVFLIPLVYLQRVNQREIQAALLLLTRNPDLSIVIFSLLFLPGIILHESSHYLAAHMVGVKTGRFSILPRQLPDGRLQLGYVETAASDWLRETLIGAAPLAAGMAFVAYAGIIQLGLGELWDEFLAGSASSFRAQVEQIYAQPDFWLWFYLTVTVSSMMLPSASDRRTWLPIGAVLVVMILTSVLAGAGPWLAEKLAPTANLIFQGLGVVFAISLLFQVVLFPPFRILRSILSFATGMKLPF